ncbi:MAG: hypothetical protein JSU70_06965 [Phycisphaerales bacterium]|nr:MAG: hypothetical protein JSU70_06965 [Phycisphaerales bacterium]
MSRRKVKRHKSGAGRQAASRAGAALQREPETLARDQAELLTKRERYLEFFLMAALLAFGTYHSVLYFGHTVVPNSDFPAFFKTGQELLSLQVPSSFKRGPVLGLLQVALSYLVGGQHPGLTAGWLLNAILHPFNLVLLLLVARELVGKSAPWLAVIAIISPYAIYLLTEPIAETTLLFFVLLTFIFILRRSSWGYLFAAIATMVRYEGAALILAAFVLDLIYSENRRERIRALLYSVMAAVPLALWMVGTLSRWQSGTSHYLSVFTKQYAEDFADSVRSRTGIILHMKLLWQVGFRPLLMPYSTAGESSADMLWKLSKTVVAVSFLFGAIYGLAKRQWKVLALLIFFVPYFILHASYPYPIPRYHSTVFWIALLLCWFGIQNAWGLLCRRGWVGRRLALVLQGVVATVSIVWLVSLLPQLSKMSPMSPRSASLPYVGMALVGMLCAVRVCIYRYKHVLRELAVLAVVCLVVVSNQFSLVGLLRDGQRDGEFKLLANWYIAQAEPGEKLGVYMSTVVRLFAPAYAECIVSLPEAEDLPGFIKACRDEGITYVVWASREGLSNSHTTYRRLGLHKNIAHLRTPRDEGPFQFVEQVGSRRGYVNIFRLNGPVQAGQPGPARN